MKIFFPLLIVFSLFLAGCTRLIEKSSEEQPEIQDEQGSATTSASVSTTEQSGEFIAEFEIYTLGTKRIFTDAKYHNLSPDVYVEKADPQKIHVKKQGITWENFFATLPMSVSSECLITGTKQTFCDNDQKQLKFLLNEVDTPNALELPIQPNDFLKIEYR